MLAGLIFATEEADDRPGVLAATLPFGGMTLLEYQARLLMTAGVSQLLVAVARVTPALLGAVSRIGKRGVTVDVVRSAEEAAAKAHPLATLVVVADGLVTTDAVVAAMALEPADALLVTAQSDMAAVERLDAGQCWAGVATLSVARLGDAARFPREYDFQSTLLRVSTQARARHVPLPGKAARSGHGVERDAGTLADRSHAVLASLAEQRTGWMDRFVLTPFTRLVLPLLVRRSVPDLAVATIGSVLGLSGLAAVATAHGGAGLVLVLVAVAILSAGSLLSWLRGEDGHAAWQERGILALGALATLSLGIVASLIAGTGTAAVLALATLAATAMLERVPARRRPWYATAASHVLVLTPFALFGQAVAGLTVVALHAAVSLAVAIEASRRQP